MPTATPRVPAPPNDAGRRAESREKLWDGRREQEKQGAAQSLHELWEEVKDT